MQIGQVQTSRIGKSIIISGCERQMRAKIERNRVLSRDTRVFSAEKPGFGIVNPVRARQLANPEERVKGRKGHYGRDGGAWLMDSPPVPLSRTFAR